MTGGRRHGEELEHALLTAAWAKLLEVGYPKLTWCRRSVRLTVSGRW